MKKKAKSYKVFLYGKTRQVLAVDKVVVLKILKKQVRVVWVFRHSQWIVLYTTGLDLSIEQIIEYYGTRWKIESGFKELKQEIGSNQCQARTKNAVTNHLNFCMIAVTLIWTYCALLSSAPIRRYNSGRRTSFAFSDIRFEIAHDLKRNNYCGVFVKNSKPIQNILFSVLFQLAT